VVPGLVGAVDQHLLVRRRRDPPVGADVGQDDQLAARAVRSSARGLEKAVSRLQRPASVGERRRPPRALRAIARPQCCKPDRRGNLYPAKQRPEQKIDAAVALMMAVGRAMAEDTNEGDLTDFLRNPLIA
jgi:hypothetical protein